MSKKCPIVKSACWEHECEFYIHLIGQNPQTNVQEDKWMCALATVPLLLIENAGQMRKVAASTDKVATEVATLHRNVNIGNKIMLTEAQRQLEIDMVKK